MKTKETLTVTIKKTDINLLKTYIQSMDSAVQSLCGAVLSAQIGSKIIHPDDVRKQKIKVGKISIDSSEIKNHFLKILSEVP